ncbi:DUF3530 family protein [Halioxenophilus aromaticivorans]|uniref:DUF3530 family protein n=1 Tax=Halioxenophilus aromaticivorans TaxID=1306992 RepID=UPI0031E74069
MLCWLVAAFPSKAQEAPNPDQTDAGASEETDQPATPLPIERIGLLPDQTPQWLIDAVTREHPNTQPHRLMVAEHNYLALLQPSQKPNNRGLVVLLPDRGQHPDWPLQIRPLRNELSESGWTVLAMALPEPNPPAIPARPVPAPAPTTPETEAEADDGDQEPAAEETEVSAPDAEQPQSPAPAPAQPPTDPEPAPEPAIPAETIVDQLTLQAFTLVEEPLRRNIVLVGVGDGGYWAARWAEQLAAEINSEDEETPRITLKLVLIEARNQLPSQAQTLPSFLQAPMPVLDLIPERTQNQPQQRRLAAQKAGYGGYFRQQHYHPPTAASDQADRRLVNRVKGFIRR